MISNERELIELLGLALDSHRALKASGGRGFADATHHAIIKKAEEKFAAYKAASKGIGNVS